MNVKLVHAGRFAYILPAVYGQMFEETCTVTLTNVERPCRDNGFVKRRVNDRVTFYWYDRFKDGNEVFCFFSGYARRIRSELLARGLTVDESRITDDGLGKPDTTHLKGVTWRPMQRETIVKVLALLASPVSYTGYINCPTAFGKTFMMKQLARAYPSANIIITAPSIDITRAIYQDLHATMPSEVGFVGDGQHNPARVTVAVSQSLHLCRKDANLIMVDECHSVLTKNFIKVFNKFLRARFLGFTATPEGKADRSDGFIEPIFGHEIINVSYQSAVEVGNVVPLRVMMVRSVNGPDVSSESDETRANRLGLWANRPRNELIAGVVRAIERKLGPDAQILVMVDKTEHAYRLGQLLPEWAIVTGDMDAAKVDRFIQKGVMLPAQEPCTAKRRADLTARFTAHTLKRAIATRIWRQGVDFRDLACLVRADGLASTIDASQIPGRLSRLGRETDKQYGLLVDFVDQFSRNLLNRSNRRMSVYRSNGWVISVLNHDQLFTVPSD